MDGHASVTHNKNLGSVAPAEDDLAFSVEMRVFHVWFAV